MRRETRLAIARLVYEVVNRILSPHYCVCRRPVDFGFAEIRDALDTVEKCIAEEPELGRGSLLEID